jgi:DNA processing protein
LTATKETIRLRDTIALLSVSGVGAGRFHRLVAEFGSPSQVMSASSTALQRVPGIGAEISNAIKAGADLASAEKIASTIEKLSWRVHYHGDSSYPARLLSIPQAPPLLFSKGQPFPSDTIAIAIVGTRHPTDRGKQFAQTLASDLATNGVIVVSGMAEGIDSAAHRGALEAGGFTAAVWGTSLDVVYPPTNKDLARRIEENGVIFSENLPNTELDKGAFPNRNRIISGLTVGVVIVEAGDKSGALITAEHAIEQGRDVYAVPGAPDAKMSVGSNGLIKQGAKLITSAQDILTEISMTSSMITKEPMALPEMTETEKSILVLFAEGPRQIDQISREMQIPVSELMEFLLALELKGVLKELSGKRFAISEEYQ